MSKLNEKDVTLLYELSKHPGWEVARRVFKENLVEAIHLQLETSVDNDTYFHQGEINGIKAVFKGVDQATETLRKIEDNEKSIEEIVEDK
jgi:hypothetical protein